MKKQYGVSVLAALIGIVFLFVGIIIGGNYYREQMNAEAIATKAAEDAKLAKAAADRAALAAREEAARESAAQEKAAKFCHDGVIKRAKYQSKARIVKTLVEKTSMRVTIDNVNAERDMYVVTGIVDMMNGYGAMLPNVYKCRVTLGGDAFFFDPAVAGENEGSDAEKVELKKALETLGLNPDDYR